MRTKKKKLTTLTFRGPMFEDHGLELDSLSELMAYKKLLLEMAKAIWKKTHPDRTRLPKGFVDSVAVKFYELEEGSTAVPLTREIPFEEGELNLELEDEVDQAAQLIEGGIQKLDSAQSLPESFPQDVIPLFEELGRTLTNGHYIELDCGKLGQPARYSPEVRRDFINYVDRVYRDSVVTCGEVRATDLDGCKFSLRLDDGTKVQGRFDPEDESMITEALRGHQTCRLEISGTAEYFQDSGKMKNIVSVSKFRIHPSGEKPYDSSSKPIWQIVSEIGDNVPEAELRKIPTDSSMNLDHYLYGREKEKE